jgi:CheY-like chemotaxis protein
MPAKRPSPTPSRELAHDLRNGLATIRNAARLLAEAPDAGVAREARATIDAEIARLLDTIGRELGGSGASSSSASAAGAGPPVARRLLVVDDDAGAATMMQRLLAARGHDVRVVHRGAEALAAARAFAPDVVLLDIALGDGDGHDVARSLRDDPSLARTLIVATTGYGTAADLRRSRQAGVDAHLMKPVDLDTLLALIARGRP